MNKNLISVLFYVKLGLSLKSVNEKITQGTGVCNAMAFNPNFATPTDPTVAELQAAVDDLIAKNIEAGNDGKTEKADLAISEANYDLLMTQMGLYVQKIADNSPALSQSIIQSACMETRKTPEKYPLPTEVTVFARFTNIGGTIKVLIKGGKYASMFQIWMTTTPLVEDSWTAIALTKKRRYIVQNLTGVTRYSFRVVPYGTAGQGPASAVATQIAS